MRKESGREFMLDPKYGFIHSCPTNLGTGMRASVHVDLPGYTKEGLPALKARFETNSLSALLHLQLSLISLQNLSAIKDFKGVKSWLCSRVVPEGSLVVKQVGHFLHS